MRKFVITLTTAIFLMFGVAAFAQDADHVEAGVFADYFRFHNANDLNMLGIGGRVGFNVHPHVAIEVEGAYDFERSTNTQFENLTNASRIDFKATHFLVGPTFKTSGPIRFFGTLKGGFVRFGVTPGPVTFGTLPTHLENTDLNGVFYPAAGIEAFAGMFGIRAEVGDEMYFDNGANNNFKASIGPVFRF